MDRRSFLALVAASGIAGLTGCTSATPHPDPSPSGSASPAPRGDDEVRRSTAQAEQELITLYAAAIVEAHGTLAAQLRVLQSQHVQHAHRLWPGQPATTDPPSPSAGEAPATTGSTRRPTATPHVVESTQERPGAIASASPSAAVSRPGTTLARLRRAEVLALDQRVQACGQATDPELVRTLCLIAASEAQHADVLAALRAEESR